MITTTPKVSFRSVIPDIISKFGTKVSRKDLLAYANEYNVRLPNFQNFRVGWGFYDLQAFINATHSSCAEYIQPMPAQPEMTDAEIEENINSRFASLDLMACGVVNGDFRSLIVSGNPGIGKTFTLETILEDAVKASKILFTGVRGYVRATGLYRLMWDHRHKECVLMMDDADSIFQDEISLNLLKGGLDTTKRRHISWRTEKRFESEDGEDIPQEFDFSGAIIFVSNLNFTRLVAQSNKLSPHLEALMSRSYYLDLNLNTTRELIIRIKNVIGNSNILSGMGIKKLEKDMIMAYIEASQDKIRELSLRTVIKLGTIWKASGKDFKKFDKMVKSTCMLRGK